MLAGAVLTNAKLPEDVARFDQLKHVEETSRNATTVFFGLLAASLYSWLTIATTTDVALITGTASSPLPIINTNIALSGFYLAAPLILIAVYFYFHLYLQRLWGGLASLPAVFPDGEALDRQSIPVAPERPRAGALQEARTRPTPAHTRGERRLHLAGLVGGAVHAPRLLAPLPPAARLVGDGASRRPDRGRRMVWGALVPARRPDAQGGATATEEEKRGDQPLRVRMWRTVRRYLPGGMEAAGAGVAIVVVLSVGAAIEPGDDLLTDRSGTRPMRT